MKVAPELSGVTALDTWLRAADTGPAPANRTSAGANIPSVPFPQPPGDPAEDLLVLHVDTAALSDLDLPGTGASAQDWADHIFSPLR
jgi:hypothetical protein